MIMNRRRFLVGAELALAAPAIIRTPGLLMPVKPLPLEWNAAFADAVSNAVWPQVSYPVSAWASNQYLSPAELMPLLRSLYRREIDPPPVRRPVRVTA